MANHCCLWDRVISTGEPGKDGRILGRGCARLEKRMRSQPELHPSLPPAAPKSMYNRAVINDEEQQNNTAPPGQDDADVNQPCPPPEPASCVSTQQPDLRPRKDEEPKHVCFLCLRGKRRTQYAIPIPCHRCRFVQRYKPSTSSSESDMLIPDPKHVRLGHHEADSAIYTKLLEACYAFHGKWKKWVPFYGVVDVRETQFYFNGPMKTDTHFEIHAVPLDHAAILQQCNLDLSTKPNEVVYDNEGYCAPWDHSSFCPAQTGLSPCIEDTLATARRIKVGLDKAYLMRDCTLDPSKADRLNRSTLDGMLLSRSPIVARNTLTVPSPEVKDDRSFTQLQPGIEIVLGWQTDRIVDDVPSIVVFVWSVLAVIWVAVIIGGAVGDQNLWVAFGQLLVASLSLLVLQLR